jgi:CMP-N-acetylneuraminic acid synthetase
MDNETHIVALQTARAGSKSVKDKNLLLVNDKPLFLYNLEFARRSRFIQSVYTSTDCPIIKDSATFYSVIERPAHLTTDYCSHAETIQHGVLEIERRTDKAVDIVAVLFGNSLGAKTEDLDAAIEVLLKDSTIDSVQSVSEFNMYNPLRASKVDSDGHLSYFLTQEQMLGMIGDKSSNDKGAIGDTYFFNGSFWICRRETLFENNGLLPFPWLGKNIYAYKQDVYLEIDAPWQVPFLENHR